MEILRDIVAGRLSLSKKGYIEKVFRKFNMLNAKLVTTPLAAHFRLSSALCPQSNEEFDYMSRVSYSSVVGSLMYAMVCSRPDLAYAVSVVSRYMEKLSKEHWKAVQWIMRYLRGSNSTVCLQFGRTIDRVVGYVDYDYVEDLDKRRSLIGYMFTIRGCSIRWEATLQSIVALLTIETKYMTIS